MINFQRVPLSMVLSPLLARTKQPYDPNDEDHVMKLKLLWTTLKPNEYLKGMVSDQWSEIGFQGKDPSTDFRGMGMLGLENLLYFCQRWTSKGQEMMLREYPFAVTGINITHFILSLLKPKEDHDDTPLRILMVNEQFSDGFLQRNVKDGKCNLFEEMYCIIFRFFDYIWVQESGSYFRFGEILKMTEKRVLLCLGKGPTNYSTFEFLLDFED